MASRTDNQQITRRDLLLAAGGLAIGGSALTVQAANEKIPHHTVQVIKSYPHDTNAFSQGLCFDASGNFYEGTGQYGESEVRRVDLQTGRVLQRKKLPRDVFGEGITIWNDRLIQLTWKKSRAIVYDLKTFRMLGTFRYRGEGWGLTFDGTHFIKSNGSAKLEFLNPQNFKVVKTLTVRAGRKQIRKLNELEYINGEIWANIWYEDYIVRIEPQTGQIVSTIDLSQLWPQRQRPHKDAVLNGIAAHPQTGQLFVTGKEWPQLFEIKVNKAE